MRELYKPYQFLLTEDARAEEFAEDTTKTIEDYRAYLTNLRDKMREISETFPIRIRMQLLEVDLQEVHAGDSEGATRTPPHGRHCKDHSIGLPL